MKRLSVLFSLACGIAFSWIGMAAGVAVTTVSGVIDTRRPIVWNIAVGRLNTTSPGLTVIVH